MKKLIVCSVWLLASSFAVAEDSGYSLFIQGGHTQRPSPDKTVNQFAVGGSVALPWRFDEGRVVTRLDTSLGIVDTKRDTVWQVTLIPAVRYQPQAVGYFVEAGLGVSYVSAERWSRGHDLGSRLNFASRLGAGYDFGAYALGAYLSHISNAGLEQPNDGANQIDVRLSFEF